MMIRVDSSNIPFSERGHILQNIGRIINHCCPRIQNLSCLADYDFLPYTVYFTLITSSIDTILILILSVIHSDLVPNGDLI